MPPPISRAQLGFWWILWLAPTGFAGTSALGIVGLEAALRMPQIPNYSLFAAWVILNLAVVILTGRFHASLSIDARDAPEDRRTSVVRHQAILFFLLQLFIIPLFLTVAFLIVINMD